MAVLDDIAAERQRLTERLARVDAERQKLADQVAELDAAERVLSRITPNPAVTSRRGRRTQSAAATPSPAAPARRGRAARGSRNQPAKPAMPLSEASLARSKRSETRPPRSRSGSIFRANSACKYGPITSEWHYSATGARAGWNSETGLVDGAAGIGRNGG